MKVFSLYHHNKFVASFPSRDEAIDYGKSCGGDAWDYDIIEEYLSKTPLIHNPYPLTNPGLNLPYITHPPVILNPFPEYDDGRVKITYNDGVKAE